MLQAAAGEQIAAMMGFCRFKIGTQAVEAGDNAVVLIDAILGFERTECVNCRGGAEMFSCLSNKVFSFGCSCLVLV